MDPDLQDMLSEGDNNDNNAMNMETASTTPEVETASETTGEQTEETTTTTTTTTDTAASETTGEQTEDVVVTDTDTDTTATTEAEETNDNASKYTSLASVLRDNKDKATNADLINLTSFDRLDQDRYALFYGKSEKDADMYLFDRVSDMWIPNGLTIQSIDIFNSGIVIKSTEAIAYVTKTNVFVAHIDTNGKRTKLQTISSNKDVTKSKIKDLEIEQLGSDLDVIKLQVKSVSTRIYNSIEKLESFSEISEKIREHLDNVVDINNHIKIEKDLMYKCNF